MIGAIRAGLALMFVAIGTAVLVPLQLLAVKTGLCGEHVLLRAWHRLALRALGIRVHVTGSMSSKRPLLLASNHISWTDVMVLGSFNDLAFIAKSELAGWPLLGSLARLQRTVFVERDRKRKSGEQAGEIAGRLSAGDVMVLFAEGSTGDGNLMLPFKSTLFGAASMALNGDAGETVFIQPVAIAYTRLHGLPMGRRHRMVAAWIGDMDLVPHLWRLLVEGALDVEVHFGEPMAFCAGISRKEAARKAEELVRAMMQDALRNPRGGRQG
ncbi:lyso-ornithine lipid O-acyltransferase [Pseudaminobacter sp. NGMCC 1.201702]|uniref:lysophospholipid acyltransferase family protein n=1 Tax=Pseudaminobacter sp. NGMCC 1.201702 TaxID=3391825 RepID=UPI0039F0DB23